MEMRMRPKSDYLHQANWEELYTLTKHWKSDMEFYRDELRFLRDLVDKYFIWMIKDENITNVQEAVKKLAKANDLQQEISNSIDKHILHIGELLENAFSHDQHLFRNEHVELENKFAAFVKSFRVLKREIFTLTETVIEEEKLKHLLSS